jgi:septum formation protein
MKLPPLILASSSPRRSELLRSLELEFRVVPSEATEVQDENLTAAEVSQLNAYRKARAVAKKLPDCLVLGADTLVYQGTQVFGKPADLPAAHQMLAALQGESHLVVTGVCLVHLRGHEEQRIFSEISEVQFRPLNDRQIAEYLSLINPLDKAGGYAIQEHGDMIVESVHGSYTNIVGLPLERLRRELAAWG